MSNPVIELPSGNLHPWRDCVSERMRVLIVAGVTTGALVAGLVSRLAMLLLRTTSPEGVIGQQSDDDFTIGRFTFAGTYNLVVFGAIVGMVGFLVYRLVKPWLLGPHWFRRATLGIASGIVGVVRVQTVGQFPRVGHAVAVGVRIRNREHRDDAGRGAGRVGSVPASRRRTPVPPAGSA